MPQTIGQRESLVNFRGDYYDGALVPEALHTDLSSSDLEERERWRERIYHGASIADIVYHRHWWITPQWMTNEDWAVLSAVWGRNMLEEARRVGRRERPLELREKVRNKSIHRADITPLALPG